MIAPREGMDFKPNNMSMKAGVRGWISDFDRNPSKRSMRSLRRRDRVSLGQRESTDRLAGPVESFRSY
jgi:hypothetical protein